MLITELLEESIRAARLNPNDEKVATNAKNAFKHAINKYSANGLCNINTKSVAVSLNEGTTRIGLPTMKKGRFLHWARDTSSLPSLDGYDPLENNFGYIGFRDFFICGNLKALYTVEQVGDEYHWRMQSNYWTNYVYEDVDIVVPFIEDVLGIVESNIEAYRHWTLIKFLQDTEGYYAQPVGNNLWEIHTHADFNATLVYREQLDTNEAQNLNLTFDMQDLLSNYISYEIARTDELKAYFKSQYEARENAMLNRNLEFAIPTLED